MSDHGKQLVEIKTSVTNLDSKVHHNHEEAKYIFSDFRNVLMDIRNAVEITIPSVKEVSMHQPEGGGSLESASTMVSGCYDPIAHKAKWIERIRDHETAVKVVRTERAAYELMLVHDGADTGSDDYRKIAYQRYPSPVLERVPDDITLHY